MLVSTTPSQKGMLFASFMLEVEEFLFDHLPTEEAEQLWVVGNRIPTQAARARFFSAVIKDLSSIFAGRPEDAQNLSNQEKYKWEPVGVEEFVRSPDYLNKADEIYPKVLSELVKINSGDYIEVVLTGGIGSAKTTAALYTNAYQLYLLSCLKNPHRLYGLDKASEILFVFQSINGKISKASYDRFQSMIESSDYFKKHFPFDKNLSSKLVFPNRIQVVPVSGQETAAIGQNVIGGMIDELNYMSIVQKSKQSVDQGTYDQAVALYNSIARRRKSRFMQAGKMPGVLALVSSKRYPGQFTDQKEEESKKEIARTGKTTIYIYDYRVWDVKPEGSFKPERFHVFHGDLTRKPRVLKKGELEQLSEADQALTTAVPFEFYEEFQKDIINALREIAGVSTLARHPYFIDVDAVAAMYGKHPSIFSRDTVDFVETKVGLVRKHFYKPNLPRYAHIDLAISGDSAGVAIGCVDGFVNMKQQGFGNNEHEMMPRIHVDGILEVKPPKNGEILFWKVREVLTTLRAMGLPIRWVSFDSFQSRDSMQLLRQQGFTVGLLSVDVTADPYDCLKSAVYTRRVAAPEHKKCLIEMISLEKDTKTGKIDHPEHGSKDCSDALAGMVHGLTTRREVWGMYGIPIMVAPSSLGAPNSKNEHQPIKG